MNKLTKNKVGIIGIYLLIFLFLLVLSLFIFKIFDGSITCIEMLQEDYLLILIGVPLFILSRYSFLGNFVSIIIMLGTIIPIWLSVKKNKLLPFVIINVLSVALWFFIGMIAFGIRNGE
jgi:hypothetical protein